jgi:alcohol dehydrogenase, propanol-preferring
VEALGDRVPETAQLAVGDEVVVSAGWGDGTCRLCRAGNEQICEHGSWPGFGPPGGYPEFIDVPCRQLIRVEHRLNWEEFAPLPDAGVTPYRGIKKLRAAGVIGPDRVMAVFGASGLGSYAAQYAKLLSSGSTIVAFARNEEKLAIAKERGADGRAVIVFDVKLIPSGRKDAKDASAVRGGVSQAASSATQR